MYRTQEAIDREYVFPIQFTIELVQYPDPGSGSLVIKVSINDWVIEFPDTEWM